MRFLSFLTTKVLQTSQFQSSFYYAWLQGALPLNGVNLAARQCLIGGNYGLLNRTTFEAQPDYFIAWIYRRLFDEFLGATVTSVHVNASQTAEVSGLRVFAFRGPETNSKRLYVVINLSVNTEFYLTLPTATGQRMEWHVQGAPDEHSTKITINGGTPRLVPGLPPTLWDVNRIANPVPAGDRVIVAPATIVFAVA